MEDIREYSSPAERARQRVLDATAAKQRTAIMVGMISYDNLPKPARDLAKEFAMSDIAKVRTHLGFEYPLSDEQWQAVGAFLIDYRAKKQEKILSRQVAYC